MEVLKKYMELTNAHNFPKMAEFLHDDCIINFAGKEWRGTEALERYYVDAWNMLKDENYWETNVSWLTETETMKVCLYQYHYEGHTDKGKLIAGTGKATNIFVLVDGDWKLIHEHLSTEK